LGRTAWVKRACPHLGHRKQLAIADFGLPCLLSLQGKALILISSQSLDSTLPPFQKVKIFLLEPRFQKGLSTL
jgi:hypothetical protein